MQTSWELTSDLTDVVLAGLVEEPADGDETPVPFVAKIPTKVLSGLACYLGRRQPWDLWVSADGEFRRDGGRCSIVAVQFGWSTLDGDKFVEIVATVRHDVSNDVTASEPQRLVTFVGDEIDRLREDIDRLVSR